MGSGHTHLQCTSRYLKHNFISLWGIGGGGREGAGTSWAGIFMGNFNQNADHSLYLKKFILTKLGR